MEVSRRNSRSGKRSPQIVQSCQYTQLSIYLHCPETILEVSVYADNIIRFRFSPDGWFDKDFSYAVVGERVDIESGQEYELREVGDEFHLITPCLVCKITKTLHISIFNKEGKLISEDERGFHWEPYQEFGGNIVYSSKKIQDQESFFGLGDKPERMNMRGLRFENWGSDMYGFEKTTDPLYKNIPFFYGLKNDGAYGILFDNTFRTRFDFGYERSDVCSFWSKGGEMNYYFIYGPELTQVAESYAQLTGVPELPPLWALGYHQSKWSYYPESKVQELAKNFREKEIPCDVIHIDIDYMDGFRCFTWDKTRFPDPAKMIAELDNDGFKAVAIIDPGIKIDKEYFVYKEAIEEGYFCRRADGPLMQGEVWPGPCHFPDFTHPKVREWWSGLFQDFMKSGIRGIWNDMNEPAVLEVGTFPDDTRHDFDGNPCSHRKAHNVYGMQMAKASYEGIQKALFPKRPFNFTRSGYAGVQRYAAVWTGDNLSTWEHLWMANLQCQRLSISGISFCGSDIGGFIGETNGELFTRWTQMAIFHPFFRTHSSGDYGDQEPWSFGEPFTAAIRKAIELRYQLLPYIYTVFWRYTNYGTPMIFPLVFLDQSDPETHYRMEEFAFGRSMLICPMARGGADGRYMYLPKGDWYNYWTNEKKEGKQEFWVDVALDEMPIFMRAGAIIPHYPVMQYVGEKEIDVLDLHVYVGKESYSSELYEDEGEYQDYKQGSNQIRIFTTYSEASKLTIEQRRTGRYNSMYSRFRFHVHGLSFLPAGMILDGETQMFEPDTERKEDNFIFEVEKNFEEINLMRLDGFA